MYRITEKMLRSRIDYLNDITGNNPEPWGKDTNGRMKANIGNYHLSHAYGGVCLHQMSNEGGGVNNHLQGYHSPKRELFNRLCAFIDGIELAKAKEVK